MTRTALLSLVQGWVLSGAPVLQMKEDAATLHTHLDGAMLFAAILQQSRFVLMKREIPSVHRMATARKQDMQISGLNHTHRIMYFSDMRSRIFQKVLHTAVKMYN
mmetsp:Transcript_27066/g.38740  ORF Transcript_27066/g.38740 Transcript_27066/m.38740 type:complete len:105 (+) Transcript_27066:247-561(+)